jgi:OmcA/MtrC family decaheme c-type cytochrome
VAPCLERSGSNFVAHFSALMPVDAAGSFTLGAEARIVVDGVRHFAMNPTLPFQVGGGAATPRRQVVSLERCNTCHQELEFHGGNRRSPDYCVVCHTPSFTGGADPLEGQTVDTMALNFKDVIHSVHAEARYPDSLGNCAHCHEDGTAEVPLSTGLLPSLTETLTCTEAPELDADDECDPATVVASPLAALPKEAAACTSCHSAPSARVHAEVNTSATGAESCATCHGSGKDQAVDLVHAATE